jgi:hypothetical protein
MEASVTKCRSAAVRIGAIAIATVALSMTPAAAQTPAVEVSGGYQYTHVPDLNLAVGWFGDVAANINDAFGVVAEVSGAHTTMTERVSSSQSVDVELTLLTYMGGIRAASHANPKVVPFVQFLAGGARLSGGAAVPSTSFNVSVSESRPATQLGGGVLLMLTNRVGIRVGADYRTVFFDGGRENEFRAESGVVVALGR